MADSASEEKRAKGLIRMDAWDVQGSEDSGKAG